MKILTNLKPDVDFNYQARKKRFNEMFLHDRYKDIENVKSFAINYLDTNSIIRKSFDLITPNVLDIDSLVIPHDTSLPTYNKTLILQTRFSMDYGHCLHDVIPTIIYHDTHSPADHIYTPGSPLIDSLIKILGIKLQKTTFVNDGEKLTRFNTKSICAHNLFAAVHHRNIKKTILFKKHVDDYINNTYDIKINNRLIYCSRNHSNDVKHQRKMDEQNEQEILNILRHYSQENNLLFTLYTGEENGKTMSHANQLKLFREAKVVIGPHGSAMANVIYLDPNLSPAVCEFTSGTEVCVQSLDFKKNYSYVNGHLLEKIYNYNLIPFIKGSTKIHTLIDVENIKQFLRSL